ncbi:MAG TPA: glycoside hydrolase family 97 N-terminal domain-containing protein, partial [Puia sp.]|nr:glycoside hydrolase family 97 N-terminal domain-containing protein [Puia sp.]
MKKGLLHALCLLLAVAGYSQSVIDSTRTVLRSPDGNLMVQFYQKRLSDEKRAMYYVVTYKSKPVIGESLMDIQLNNSLSEKAMGLKVNSHAHWCENLRMVKVTTESKDLVWTPVNGERSGIKDRYNEALIGLMKDDNPIYTMNVEIRAYNEGVAFRYFFPENPKGTYYRVVAENTEFHLPDNTLGWFANWGQGPYSLLPLRDWPGESERPLTLQLKDGLWVSLAEGAMVDYSRTKFRLSTVSPNTLVTSMHDPADLIS